MCLWGCDVRGPAPRAKRGLSSFALLHSFDKSLEEMVLKLNVRAVQEHTELGSRGMQLGMSRSMPAQNMITCPCESSWKALLFMGYRPFISFGALNLPRRFTFNACRHGCETFYAGTWAVVPRATASDTICCLLQPSRPNFGPSGLACFAYPTFRQLPVLGRAFIRKRLQVVVVVGHPNLGTGTFKEAPRRARLSRAGPRSRSPLLKRHTMRST